jgi:acetyl esterase/lipase
VEINKNHTRHGTPDAALSWQARIYRVAFRLGFKPFLKYGSIPVMRAYMDGFDRAISASSAMSDDTGGFHVESTEHGELLTPLAGDSRTVILYVPGGGFIIRSPNAHRVLVRRICKQVNASASIVHYRLSPSTHFPPLLKMWLPPIRIYWIWGLTLETL